MVSNALNIDSTFVIKKLISFCNRKTNGIGFYNIHHLSYTVVILRLKAYGSYGRFVMQSIPYYYSADEWGRVRTIVQPLPVVLCEL